MEIGSASGDDLFASLARGEGGAIDELCRCYGYRVAAAIRRGMGSFLRSRMEPDDLYQEAMAEIIRWAPRYRFHSERAFLGWLHKIVAHTIAQQVRRIRWRELTGLEDATERADPSAERPSQVFLRKEAARSIEEALSRLKPADRAVLETRLIHGRTWLEVASSLGLTPFAAQMRFVRARLRLARVLGKAGITAA